MNTLATAMERADIQELEDAAIELGQAAVRQSLDQPSSMAQYSADAAMADANEVVARAMRRYGRRVPAMDGATPDRHGRDARNTQADEIRLRLGSGLDVDVVEVDAPGREQLSRLGAGASARTVIEDRALGGHRGPRRPQLSRVQRRGDAA